MEPDSGTEPEPGRQADRGAAPTGFLSFAEVAVDRTAERIPGIDRSAMTMVLLLHRVVHTLVYDLESTVHRPAGWSWSAFRLLFTLWISGGQEASRAAELTGLSRAAVSNLAKTLAGAGLLDRSPDERDGRGVVLSLTAEGTRRLEATFAEHNRREHDWATLLDAEELDTLNRILSKLAGAAQIEEWVSHRNRRT